MNRGHAAIVSLVLALTAVGLVVGVAHTIAIGPKAQSATDAQVAERSAQLDRYRASLLATLAERPPPLPPIPHGTSNDNPPQTRVVYRRPAPVIVHVRRDEQAEGSEDDD